MCKMSNVLNVQNVNNVKCQISKMSHTVRSNERTNNGKQWTKNNKQLYPYAKQTMANNEQQMQIQANEEQQSKAKHSKAKACQAKQNNEKQSKTEQCKAI